MTTSGTNQRAALVERDAELTQIDHLLTSAAAGEGQLCVIEGPIGTGKSRLLAETRARADRAGFVVLAAHGAELEFDNPFGLVLQLFEARLPEGDRAEQRQVVGARARLVAALRMASDHRDEVVLAGRDFSLLRDMSRRIVNLTELRPTALLVDDVHWADAASLRFLSYLAQRLANQHLAIVVTVRTGDGATDFELVTRLAAAATQAPIKPAELSRAGMLAMFESAGLADSADVEVIDDAWEATGGNPFLADGLIEELRRRGAGASVAGHVSSAPRAVCRRLALRLAAMGPEAEALARASAVLGDGHSQAVGAAVAGLSSVAAAAQLLSAGFLSEADPIRFAHPMIRSAVYESIPAGERERVHATAAEQLAHTGADAGLVAHHVLLGGPTTQPWAFAALRAGARQAEHNSATGIATQLLRHAVECRPPAEQRPALLIDLGLLEAAAGESTALTRFEQALDIAADRDDKVRALQALGQTLYRYGRHREAAETFLRGARLAGDHDAELALMFEGAYMSAALYVQPGLPSTVPRMTSLAHSIKPTTALSSAQRVILVLLALHRALISTPAVEESWLARLALGDGDLLSAQTSDSLAVNLAAVALMVCGQDAEGSAILDEVLRDAQKRGATLAFAEASALRALLSYRRGRIDDAAMYAEKAIMGAESGWNSLGALAHTTLAHCLMERGELEDAEAVLTAGEPMLERDSKILNAWFYVARGRLHHLRGEPSAALTDFLAAGATLSPYGVANNPTLLSWRAPAALAARAAGDERSGELIETEVTRARAVGLGAPLGAALRCRAQLVEPVAAEADLETAVALLEPADASLELARALIDLGALQRRAGRRAACRLPLERGRKLADEAGATALAAHAMEELYASGVRRLHPAYTDSDGLTPAERRIAELAAAGHTNRQIAEKLVISKNTVAWHLRQVYRKLDLDSRSGLEERLTASDSRNALT